MYPWIHPFLWLILFVARPFMYATPARKLQEQNVCRFNPVARFCFPYSTYKRNEKGMWETTNISAVHLHPIATQTPLTTTPWHFFLF